MSLTMRPTGLASGFYKDKLDYGVYCGQWCIGRIYENCTGPEDLRWFWAFHAPSKPGEMRTSNRVATLDEANAEFEASWEKWKAWAAIEEVTRTGDALKRYHEAGCPSYSALYGVPQGRETKSERL